MLRRFAILALCGAALTACASEGSDQPPAAANAAAAHRLDSMQVPADLRHLVPMAERWGIGDDVDRGAKVREATPAEREALRNAIAPHQARITAWLDSFGQNPMPAEAAAFMYMQLAGEEMTVGSPP